LARRLKKPWLLIDLSQGAHRHKVRDWVTDNEIRVLNVAGPREGEAPGIHERTSSFLREVLAAWREEP
jgi:hypothetical protein